MLLAYAVQYLTEENQDTLNEITYKTYLLQSRIVKETTIMAIFLATPVACYSLALLSPVLLSKKNGRRSVSFRHSDIQQNIPAFVSKPGTTNQIGNPSGGLPPNQPNNDFRNGLGSRIDNDPDIPLTKSQSRFRLKNLFGRQTPRMLNSQS